MRKKRKLILKYLLLISVLMLMMLLCACRVRLTNNTEVASTITDEDGWLTDSYQMRRDQLGEPVAERPIFKGFDSGDDEEDYSDIDYEPLDYDQGTMDEWEEPEDTSSNTPSSSTNRNSSGGGSGSSSGSKDEEEEEPPQVEMVKLTYDLKEGGGIMNTIDVEKGAPFSKYLPDVPAAPKGYSFNGWHTKENEESPVDPDATITEDCTIYAHWKADPKPEYTVTWKYEQGTVTAEEAAKLPQKIKNGEKFPDPMPVAHKKNYRFLGWFSGSDPVAAGQPCTADSTLEAKFSDQPWDLIYNNAAPFTQGDPPADQKKTFVAENNTAGLVRGTDWKTLEAPEKGPEFVIMVLEADTFTEEAAKTAAKTKREENDGKYNESTIIVVPKDAAADANKLYYQLILHTKMYGDLEGVGTAGPDTEAVTTAYYVDLKPEA